MTRARIIQIAIALSVAAVPAVVIAYQFGDTRTALDRSLESAGFYPLAETVLWAIDGCLELLVG